MLKILSFCIKILKSEEKTLKLPNKEFTIDFSVEPKIKESGSESLLTKMWGIIQVDDNSWPMFLQKSETEPFSLNIVQFSCKNLKPNHLV